MGKLCAAFLTMIWAAAIIGCSCQGLAGGPVKWYSPLDPKVGECTRAAVERRSAAVAGRPFHVLVLSGGGAWGAWGAGVLSGWRDNPDEPRPVEFDVVTGISVGAIIASHAFLGEPADDESLRHASENTHNGSIYFPKPVALIPFALLIPNPFFNSASWANAFLGTNSAASSEPLRQSVARLVTDDVIRRVAEAARSGRRLLVGTTPLGTGILRVWDMTEIAAGDDPKRFDRYRMILLAAMSVAIAMPPVEIDGDYHVDGGVRTDLLCEPELLPPDRPGRRTIVHAVVNQPLSVPADPAAQTSMAGMISRTTQLIFNSSLIGQLYRAQTLCRDVGAEFRFCAIPAEAAVLNPLPQDFCPHDMRRLYAFAKDWAANHRWLREIAPRSSFATAVTQ